MIEWDAIAEDFAPDGSLRDVYVLETNAEDWERVLTVLGASCASVRYSVDGVEQPAPPSAQTVFAIHSVSSPSLRVAVGGIEFACHFFTTDEIEFDFLPSEVDGSDRLESLLGFVRNLGRTTGKCVVVTPENAPELPFLRYDPSKEIVEHVHE